MDLTQSTPWLLLLVAVAVVLLVRGRGYHEAANREARACCRQNGLQLLDGTVAYAGFSFLWRRLRITRTYRFEYSLDGADRYKGFITLWGNRAVALRIEPDHLAARTIH